MALDEAVVFGDYSSGTVQELHLIPSWHPKVTKSVNNSNNARQLMTFYSVFFIEFLLVYQEFSRKTIHSVHIDAFGVAAHIERHFVLARLDFDAFYDFAGNVHNQHFRVGVAI